MTAVDFLDAVSPLPEHDAFYFVSANRDKSVDAQHAFARAYVDFRSADDVFLFKDKFDGYVFMDGNQEFPAVVEFAPYQGKVNNNVQKKVDPKVNTLNEEDADYAAFLLGLEKEENAMTMEQQMEELEAREKEKAAKETQMTPLLEAALEKQAEKKRLRDEKRRKKDEEKRKAKAEGGDANVNVLKKKEEQKATSKKDGDSKASKANSKATKNEQKTSSSKPEQQRDQKASSSRSERDKERRKRRDEERRQQRKQERQNKAAEEQNKKDVVVENVAPAPNPQPAENAPSQAATSKPKRYSDRRKELKKQQQEKDAQVTVAVKEEEEEDVTVDVEEGDEDIQAAKPTSSRRNRRDRVKNKERPAMQLYQPGMKKGGNKKAEDGAEEAPKGRRGGGQGGGRVFYNKNRNQQQREQ